MTMDQMLKDHDALGRIRREVQGIAQRNYGLNLGDLDEDFVRASQKLEAKIGAEAVRTLARNA